MERAFTFVFFLFWFTRKCTDEFPLPFTWIFKDLSKFIFEPMCVQIFRRYLEEKEGGQIEFLEEIMQIYLRIGK
jgi:hypothetical protein